MSDDVPRWHRSTEPAPPGVRAWRRLGETDEWVPAEPIGYRRPDWFWPIRWLLSWPRQWWGSLSYAVRPYDMTADDRRWFWQRRAECGSQWVARHPYLIDELNRAFERREAGQ